MGTTLPAIEVQVDPKVAAIEADVRQQMNKELGEDETPAHRSIMAQKYGLTIPVFTKQERQVIENRLKLEAKRSKRAGNDSNA